MGKFIIIFESIKHDYIGGGGRLPAASAITRNTKNIIKNMTNNIFAIPAAAAATPVNPNTPAIMAIIRNTNA